LKKLNLNLENIYEWINPWAFDLLDCDKDVLICYGGSGSGKSYFAAQKLIYRIITECTQHPDLKHGFLVLRKELARHLDSTIPLLLDVLEQWGMRDIVKVNMTDKVITFPQFNNSFIKFRGLDKASALKSIQGVTGVWAEESDQIEESDMLEIMRRLRPNIPVYTQILITFNPVSSEHWLKSMFFDDHDPSTVEIKRSTLLENKFMTLDTKKRQIRQMKGKENDFRIYILGEWGQASTEGIVYKAFSYTRHVRSSQYNPLLPLHLSTDQNIVPYYSGLLFQVQDKEIRVIDEFALTNPNNSTYGLCEEFRKRFPDHEAGLFIYGDATSRKGDTRGNENDYQIMLRVLSGYKPVLRVPKSNPPVMMRTQWINQIFCDEFEGIKITIDPKCGKFLDDLMYGKEAPDGGKLKERAKNKITGQTYEKYHHHSDAFDYMMCAAFHTDYQKFVRGRLINVPIVPRRAFNQRRF
jgi:phage terminase large subunit